jgi:hypothetical protein
VAAGAASLYGQSDAKQTVTEFMGHKVILVEPKRDANGFPEESYRVCFDATTPRRRCYEPPTEFAPFGLSPELKVIDLGRGRTALFFAVSANFGGPGTIVSLALLHPGQRDEIDNRLVLEGHLSEISTHLFWNESSVSDAPILVTANYVWGDSEARFDDHRFIVSAYVLKTSLMAPEDFSYRLEDRYMTIRKYASDDRTGVLAAEKPEILARLKRVKAEEERRKKTPR